MQIVRKRRSSYPCATVKPSAAHLLLEISPDHSRFVRPKQTDDGLAQSGELALEIAFLFAIGQSGDAIPDFAEHHGIDHHLGIMRIQPLNSCSESLF